MKYSQPKVIGCGGIATWLLPPLCHYAAHTFKQGVEVSLIDGDTFEENNRDRQVFQSLGNKAEVKANELRKKYPGVFFWSHPIYVTSDNTTLLIRENDVVFLCVDNHKTRQVVSQRCEELDNIVLISGGNDYTDGNIQVHVKRDGENITLPVANKYHPEILHAQDRNPGDQLQARVGCQQLIASEPQLLIMNNAIASLIKI